MKPPRPTQHDYVRRAVLPNWLGAGSREVGNSLLPSFLTTLYKCISSFGAHSALFSLSLRVLKSLHLPHSPSKSTNKISQTPNPTSSRDGCIPIDGRRNSFHVEPRRRCRQVQLQAGVAGRRYTPRQYSESERRALPGPALRRRVHSARNARHPAQ